MDSLTKFALDILRDRNFSRLEEDVREEVLSLFIDDHRKPSKEGRRTLALNAGLLAAYSALFDHGLASKFDQRFASIRSTGNLTSPTAF